MNIYTALTFVVVGIGIGLVIGFMLFHPRNEWDEPVKWRIWE